MQIDNTCGSEGVKWEFSFPVKLSKRVVLGCNMNFRSSVFKSFTAEEVERINLWLWVDLWLIITQRELRSS